MKKLLFFLTIILISCSAWGANIPAGTKLYLTPNSNWKTDNARYAAYFFGNGEEWVSMTNVAGETDIYEVTSPSKSFTNVIFCRMNPSALANNWNNKWNQTADLIYNGTNNHYTVKESTWDKGGGTWSTYTPSVSFKNLNKTYYVGGTYTFESTSSGLTNPTCTYFVDGKEINEKTYTFLEVKDYTLKVTATAIEGTVLEEKIVNVPKPVVTFTKPTETYIVGDRFTLKKATATQILLNPTYTYKVNNAEIDPNKDYLFKEIDDYVFSVEVKNNKGNILATSEYTITISEMTPVYLKPNSNWTQASARFAVYYWDSNGDGWVSMEKLTNDLYAAYIPKNCTGLIFVRINPSAQTNSWDGKWNQTGDLTIPTDGKNKFTIPNGAWDGSTSSWSTYTPSTLYITGDFGEVELSVNNNSASTSKTGAFGDGTYDVVVNDGTRYWQNVGSVEIKEVVPTIDFTIDAITKEITITHKNSFTTPSALVNGTEYGKLTYQFSMPSNQWYWISLPFNVDIDQITTSTGNGAKDLVITYYDAKIRAENGKGGWMNAKEQKLTTLTANQGYVIGFYTDENTLFPANGVTVNFPSASTTNTVADSTNLATTEAIGKNEKDNNWHIIGTGLYHKGSLSNINYVAMPAKNGKDEDTYEYKYISSENELFTAKLETNSFDPFTAFFVQYGGEYSATAEVTKSSAELAPVARAKAQEQEQIYLINMNEAHTVVILNAEGSEGYTAGEDFLEMNIGSHIEMIYSFDGTDALAFNHRATEAQSINLGGYVATAGEQIISLNGYNANVESVTLIDNFTGETADLLAGDYTFTAEVGSLDGRFTVVFGAQKAGNTTVDCYNSTANQLIAYGSANACTVSGLTTGEAVVVYNAMGQLVFATIADSETITLPTLPTGNYLILHNGTTNKTLLK